MSISNIIKDPNTNWKYVLIVLVLGVLVGGGILGYQEYTARQETPTPTPPIDETADWKVYRNEEYGFEVKYPQVGNIEEDSYSDQLNVNFGNISSNKAVKISVVPQQMEGVMREAVNIQSETEIIVDKVKGSKITGIDQKGFPTNEIWVKYNNRIYLVKGEGEIFNQILSTFQLLE